MFAKGHGTQNDFVLLPDPDGRLSLTPAAVTALCDRRRGLGADGVLRVTKAEAAMAAGVFDRLPEGVAAGDWYMDYRNADGSIAQMCGNGVRVFAHYLRASGLESRDEFIVGSLAGPRPVVLHEWDDTTADVTVEMGKTNQLGTGEAIVGGRPFAGLARSDPRRACGPGRRGAGFVRSRSVSRRRERRGLDGAAQWGGVDAGTRARCRRDSIVWHRNSRRRRCGAGFRGRDKGHAAGAHSRWGSHGHGHRREQLSPRSVGAGRAGRVGGGMVAHCATLIPVHECA